MKSKHDNNFNLRLREGSYQCDQRYLLGVPNILTEAMRKRYEPYVNIHDERGIVGTLNLTDLRRLRLWMDRVGI